MRDEIPLKTEQSGIQQLTVYFAALRIPPEHQLELTCHGLLQDILRASSSRTAAHSTNCSLEPRSGAAAHEQTQLSNRPAVKPRYGADGGWCSACGRCRVCNSFRDVRDAWQSRRPLRCAMATMR
eukprot:6188947-Pleurochrysis_carterae.AAC.1